MIYWCAPSPNHSIIFLAVSTTAEKIRRQRYCLKIVGSIFICCHFATLFRNEFNLAMLTMATIASPW